ncbi:type II secretion system protein [Duganella sp. BJB1802]|uniref:type II secretion system protein n=1 Tax=Duganella sp. BJB1802 TaxID=2744575 RepID=UPI001594A51A|nr:type II secretion system protein [Duganella sp. BJB1802]NVD69234.1 type II secretion system protein [Duganella sp. BJB1802]
MARRTNSFKRQRGFAYLWTLMLVAFMGVGLTIAADLYATAMRRDKERELLFIGHEFRHALEAYNKANGAGQYPLTLEELLKDPRFPSAKRHLRRLYNDPITGKPDWALVLQQGRIVGIRSTSAQRPIKQDNFDDDDAGLAKKPRYADWLFTYPHDLFTVPQSADAKR